MTSETGKKAGGLIEQIHASGLKAPARIFFGNGARERLGPLAVELACNKKLWLVTGASSANRSGLLAELEHTLHSHQLEPRVYSKIIREPTMEMMDEAVEQIRKDKPSLVISLGGGSVLDAGKALAALAVNEGAITDYLEGGGTRATLDHAPLPHIAVPTVAGTGSEMTKNAVIGLPKLGVKRSMRFAAMIPAVAVVDPELTLSVPPRVTAFGGMDAITQLIEPCISTKRRPETTALALEGLRLSRTALTACYEHPDDFDAREKMSLASLLSGVCLANAGLAMAHGIAAALGALFHLPHGLSCALLLPHTLRYNRDAAEEPLKQALAAFLNKEPADTRAIEEGLQAIEDLNQWLQIPPNLKFLALTSADLEQMAERATGSSMSGNPIPMTPELTLRFLQSMI